MTLLLFQDIGKRRTGLSGVEFWGNKEGTEWESPVWRPFGAIKIGRGCLCGGNTESG